MTRAIAGLLRNAASEAALEGAVSTITAMALADEGFDLSALDREVEAILKTDIQ